MSIQIAVIISLLHYLQRKVANPNSRLGIKGRTTYAISSVMTMLFVGHVIQVAVWAGVFMEVGEFSEYATAFYHSMVNFASLGYGDIVMSEKWRLLGAIEASAGVLMFGLSAGVMLSIMSFLLAHDVRLQEFREELKKHDKKSA
ncbi:MAG: ion channel [Lysobacterales bacterium]